MQNLEINKANFLFFLDSLSKLNDSAILNLTDGGISAISTNPDASLILLSNMEAEFDDDVVLNIPSISKLQNAIKLCNDDENIKLTINRNNLEYRGKTIKFKYHLYEDGILTKAKMSLQKLQSLTYDIETSFTKAFLKNILKVTSAFSNTNKLYVYTENDYLMWSLQDATVTNSDSFTIKGHQVDFELESFIMNLDNLRIITFPEDTAVEFNINTKLGIGNMVLQYGSVNLNYIISSLIK